MPIKDPVARKAYLARKYQENKDQIKANVAAWRAANPDKVKQYESKHKEANPDRIRAAKKKYAAKPGVKAKAPERQRQWRQANPEKAREASRRHEATRPPRALDEKQRLRRTELNRVRYNTDPQVRIKNAEYRKANLDKYAAYQHQRGQKVRNGAVSWDRELTELVTFEATALCRARLAATGFHWEVDHVIPIQGKTVSGLHIWSNIAVIPRSQNRRKSNSFQPQGN